jgi:hypothetical protein
MVIFDTSAFGSFVDVAIETIDDKEYIVATAEIRKRFTTACSVILSRIKAGTLHTSWEIAVSDSTPTLLNGMVTKVINAGRFIGHCLLGEDVEPAYDSSGLLQIASNEYVSDIEIAESLIADMLEDSYIKINEKEDTMAKNKLEKVTKAKVDETLEVSNETEEVVEETEVEDANEDVEDTEDVEDDNEVSTDEDSKVIDTSQLTAYDIMTKIESQVEGWVAHLFPEEKECLIRHYKLDDLEYHKYSYSVENDEVKLSEPETIKLVYSVRDINEKVAELEKQIAEKDELILKSSSEVQTLKSENSELTQYKDKFDKAEQERITAELEAQKEELISLVVSSGLITREEIEQSEELSGYVAELDKKSLMSEVGQRLADSIGNKSNEDSIEISENQSTNPSTNLNNDDSEKSPLSIVKTYLNKGGK